MGFGFPWTSQVFFWEKQCAKSVKKIKWKVGLGGFYFSVCICGVRLTIWSKSSGTKGQTREFAGIELKQNITSVLMMLLFRWAAWKGTPRQLQMLYTLSIMYAESTPRVSTAKQISTCIPAVPMFLHLPMCAWSISGGSSGWDALQLFLWQLKGNLSISLGKDQGEQWETLNTWLISFHSFSVKAGSSGDLCLWPHHLAEASQAESFPGESWGKNKTCVAVKKISKPPFDGQCDFSQELAPQNFLLYFKIHPCSWVEVGFLHLYKEKASSCRLGRTWKLV